MDVNLQILKKNGGGFRTLSFVWDDVYGISMTVYCVLDTPLLVLLSVYFFY